MQNAQPPSGSIPPPQDLHPQKSVEDSFAELKRLHDMGMITDEEFEEKRKELVGRI